MTVSPMAIGTVAGHDVDRAKPLVVEGAHVVVAAHVVGAVLRQHWPKPFDQLRRRPVRSATPHGKANHTTIKRFKGFSKQQ